MTVTPARRRRDIGDSAYVYEHIMPANATNKCVLWSSCDPEVAAVNPISGLVTARSEGCTVVYATAQDGSGKQGYCDVTVKPPVLVECMSLAPTQKTMSIGDTATLTLMFCPEDATDKTVEWESSNPQVASVDETTGVITAISADTATITAKMNDGKLSAICVITVDPREKVRLVASESTGNEDYFDILFSDGTVWKNVGRDLQNSDSFSSEIAWSRYNFNQTQTFTEQQLAYIYLFDPLGVEQYVKYFYIQSDLSSVDLLFYKDGIYEAIFGTAPRYFTLASDGTPQYIVYQSAIDSSNRLAVYSEAEILFGGHALDGSFVTFEFWAETLTSVNFLRLFIHLSH